MDDLQDVADDLAETIGRGVAIDDRRLRLLVHSAHDDDADAARKHSILFRRVPADVETWAFAHGIDRAQGPVRVPGKLEHGAQTRMVFPLRSQGLLLGFLTVLDPDGTLSETDVRACTEAASTAAGIRYRQRLLHDAERTHEQQMVRELLFAPAERRDASARRLADEGLLQGGDVSTFVLRWQRTAAPAVQEDVDLLVRRALDKVRRTLPVGSMVELPRPDDAVVLVAVSRLPDGDPRRFADLLLAQAREHAAAAIGDLVVGFGAETPAVGARMSYDQALRALHAAQRLPGTPNPVGWRDLGVNRMVTLFPLGEGTLAEVPPGCRELFRHPELLHTVERYLDLAGDVKATASELNLHRASLYTRLQKAERVTGLSLRRGDDRLALALGVRLLRLAGCNADTAADAAA